MAIDGIFLNEENVRYDDDIVKVNIDIVYDEFRKTNEYKKLTKNMTKSERNKFDNRVKSKTYDIMYDRFEKASTISFIVELAACIVIIASSSLVVIGISFAILLVSKMVSNILYGRIINKEYVAKEIKKLQILLKKRVYEMPGIFLTEAIKVNAKIIKGKNGVKKGIEVVTSEKTKDGLKKTASVIYDNRDKIKHAYHIVNGYRHGKYKDDIETIKYDIKNRNLPSYKDVTKAVADTAGDTFNDKFITGKHMNDRAITKLIDGTSKHITSSIPLISGSTYTSSKNRKK